MYREYYLNHPECPPGAEEHLLKIGEKTVPYQISRSTRNKRITLKIQVNGSIIVCAPYDAPTNLITDFVESRKTWIAPKIDLPSPDTYSNNLYKGAARTSEEETGQITYEGHVIAYSIRRSTRARRVTIKIDRNREVCVVSPPDIPASEINAFLHHKAEWIYTHTIISERPLPPERNYQDGELFPFMGGSVTIRIRRGDNLSWEVHGDELKMVIPGEFTEYHTNKAVKKIISAYYADQIYQFSMPFFRQYAKCLKIPVPVINIRDQKTKWGSCTPRSINLNLRLCMAPKNIIEYVIAHEIAHKINPDHSPQFWKTVEQLMPDYRERRKYLKEHGYEWVL